ncbi:MAG: tRNA epoxyqueuosine(34) reductase QueG [Bdellovibrionota bacterium]
MAFEDLLQKFIDDAGFAQWGATKLERPLSFTYYENWIREGHHGEMAYLETHLPIKENPETKWPEFKSVIVFSIPYYPTNDFGKELPVQLVKTAFYAQNWDYHHWVKDKLQGLTTQLQQQHPNETFAVAVDSSPLMERDYAHRAGLGWFGKNTCLIHPKKGSLFFLAEILTSLNLEKKNDPIPDFCGKCQRCMEVCPTGAIEAPRILNAQKCISYLTIESREVPPIELRDKMGSWFFGCDLCQTICPWNQKIFTASIHHDETPTEADTENRPKLIKELEWILTTSGNQLQKSFAGTPMARAGSFGLKRNAIVVAANKGLTELAPSVELLLGHEKLGELAQWCLEKFARNSADE